MTMTNRIARGVALALSAAVVSCRDAVVPVTPLTPPTPPVAAPAPPAGIMEIRIAGIGTPNMSASATVPVALGPRGARFTLAVPKNGDGSGDGTIQLQSLSTGSFTSGTRGSGGVRYVWATFNVRNAQSGGTAYNTPRTNLTFFATNTGINASAMSQLLRFDGSAASTSIATQIKPTGNVSQLNGQLVSSQADVLQIITGAEAAALGSSILPYGFVVHNASNGGRTLAASPAANQFDGVVTFAFSFPLQGTADADPYTVVGQFQAADDSQTRITQSLQEQGAGQTAFETRATAISAAQVTTLPGGAYSGGISSRRICFVRIAGTSASPTATLVNTTAASFTSFSPNPFATNGSGQFLPTTTSLSAIGDCPFSNAPTAQNFVVNGNLRGRYFLTGSYTTSEPASVNTPTGTFFPGEEVDLTATTGLGSTTGLPFVSRLRIATTAGSGTFGTATSYTVGAGPRNVQVADLNRDGKLDIVTLDVTDGTLSMLLGNGDGTFAARTTLPTAPANAGPYAIGDVNGDGKLDIVVFNPNGFPDAVLGAGSLDVLPGNGDGTFGAAISSVSRSASAVTSVILGEVNGDGALDAIMHNQANVVFLAGNGNATFGGQTVVMTAGSPFQFALGNADHSGNYAIFAATQNGIIVSGTTVSTGARRGVALGDFNNDGWLDMALAAGGGAAVHLNTGTGSFNSAVTTFGSGNANAVVVGDVNGDGKLDIVLALGSADAVEVLIGNGDGTFGAGTNYTVGDNPLSVALADVNGDGRLDIITANSNAGTVSVLLGQP